MQLMLSLNIPTLPEPIKYSHKILLAGSCFTEHISERLAHHKFSVLSNPNGILFNPLSVADSLQSYLDEKHYKAADLFYLNELWNSWQHHTRFSHVEQETALLQINESQKAASHFMKTADWIIITLGSAFQYYLRENGTAVANNHRAPAQWFEKRLLEINVIVDRMAEVIRNTTHANPGAKFLFTISPVRHIRDGVIENNRSKARLIEAVHELCSQFDNCFYFPAYELLIDILRDYRFYDIDFVHPNYLATNFVWEQFSNSCIAATEKNLMSQISELMISKAHRARFPETEAHQKFMLANAEKAKQLMKQFSFVDLNEELKYFES